MPYADRDKQLEYQRNYERKRYSTDAAYRERNRARRLRNDKKYKQERDKLLAEFRKSGCRYCTESEPCCLSTHHVRGIKEFDIGRGCTRKVSPSRLAKELTKCDCVCENCHRKIHAGILLEC